ncbi:MAG: DUF6463 family protein [Gammaproteobacteria bacterium]|nr:DUF6463 family protein [Gammaproteobacteria bacterium]MCF6261765.1 DUF6463 family protein [Gammaproteobacteria bacterium]
MRLWQYSGLFLIGTGVIHNLIGFVAGWDMLVGMVYEGLWNTVTVPIADGAQHTRAELLWFLMLGFAWMMVGTLLHGNIQRQKIPPATSWGWILFAQGLFIAVVLPASGAWLFLPQGLIIIFANRQS